MMSATAPRDEGAYIIDGRVVARAVRGRVGDAVERLLARSIHPTLGVIRVGDDPGSASYVRSKRRAAERVGFRSIETHLPADAPTASVDAAIDAFNADDSVDGILLQLPLPSHLEVESRLLRIAPEKDVDGLHPLNLGQLLVDDTPLRPCTPAGVIELLRSRGVGLRGKEAVVIGRSRLVGRPLALLLLHYDATVTLCHRRTPELQPHIERADLVVAAAGVPNLVKGAWIKPGAVVIDVGNTRLDDGSVVGDVEFEAARLRAGAITPVPGGVGPMTVAMLLRNTVVATRLRRGLGPDPELR